MSEPTPEQAELQIKIQAVMHIMIQSMIHMLCDRFEEEVEDLFEDSDFDLVLGTCFVKAAAELAIDNEVPKDSFMSMCQQLYDMVEFHNSTPIGNA